MRAVIIHYIIVKATNAIIVKSLLLFDRNALVVDSILLVIDMSLRYVIYYFNIIFNHTITII